MYQRTKRDYLLMRMVNSFEDQQANGLIGYWEEEDLNALIAHYESESKIDKAMDVVNLGLKRFPFQFEYFLIKARLLLYSSQTELALKVLDDAQNVAPSEPEIRLLRGEILCAGEAYDLALEIFEDVKGDVFGEDLCRVLIRESYIHESMKDFASMFYTLKQALEIDPNNNEALEQIWMSVELSKKYDESITLHTALIDKNPYSYLAWFNLGHAYSCLGEYEKAIDALEYAFIINPDFEAAYMDCAEICFQEKKYEKAFKIYEEVNELFGPDAETLVFMVECLIPLNEYEKAMSLLLMSLTIDPYNDEVHFYLGECHASMGNWKDAIKAYNKAIKIEDRREEYNSSLANAYEQVGEIKLANHYHKKATHIASEQNLYWIKHALFAKRCIGVEAALDILNKADLFAVGSDLMYHRAACMFELGLIDQGMNVLEEALVDDKSWVNQFIDLYPEALENDQIVSMIKYYQGEQL